MDANIKAMVVIADDLTGANDTGVQFARRGMQVEVLLEGTSFDSIEADVVVIDTNSRAATPEEAYQRVQQAAKQAKGNGFQHFYKKLDSTLRGNVGVEVKAILDLAIHDFAFIMPAFPQTGRTTVGGNHLLNGFPLAATEIARDPKCPVYESCLPELLVQQMGLPVVHIGVNELLDGAEAVQKVIQDGIEAECKVFSCDAWLDEHFLLAAQAASALSDQVLWVGSAGLADCLPQLFGWEELQERQEPTLVIAGSVSSVTRGQVAALLKSGYELIEIEVADYLPWEEVKAYPLLQEIIAKLKHGQKIVIASGYQADAVERAKAVGATLGITSVQVSEIIAHILGWFGSNILLHQEVTGVILTGGDTAVAVCRALGVTGIQIIEEVAPAIPLGAMTISNGKRVKVITKAGAFGSPDALVKASKKLQQRK